MSVRGDLYRDVLGIHPSTMDTAAVRLAVLDERERCARIVEKYSVPDQALTKLKDIAAIIRRGE